MTDKSESQKIIEQNLRERMASLEATNNFHRETLNDISVSLKEVVKTQHVLANQRDEIYKLINVVGEVQKEIVDIKQRSFESSYKVNENREEIAELKVKIKEMNSAVTENTNFVKTVAKIITFIGIPLIIAVVTQYIKK